MPPVCSAIMRIGPCMFSRTKNSLTCTSVVLFSALIRSLVASPVASSVYSVTPFALAADTIFTYREFMSKSNSCMEADGSWNFSRIAS